MIQMSKKQAFAAGSMGIGGVYALYRLGKWGLFFTIDGWKMASKKNRLEREKMRQIGMKAEQEMFSEELPEDEDLLEVEADQKSELKTTKHKTKKRKKTKSQATA